MAVRRGATKPLAKIKYRETSLFGWCFASDGHHEKCVETTTPWAPEDMRPTRCSCPCHPSNTSTSQEKVA